ncbi:hypothetical protein [Pseudalgibacter alginicilyticus]|nr:hypothetical protein [Pseudalgibacter alginicilyticus]
MDFKFDEKSQWIYFSGIAFKLVKKKYFFDSKLSESKFDLYETVDKFDDGMGPALFNKDYGVLNIDNGWGKFFIYLKTDIDSILAKKIILKVSQ